MTGATLTPVTPRRVLHSEWIKFRTLRSSWYTLIAAMAAIVVIGVGIGYLTSTSNWLALQAEDRAPSGPLQGFLLAQLLIGVLGVLFVTGEYGTGMIWSTLAAVPRRLPVLCAKALVFGAVALVAMTVSSFAAFFGAQLFLAGHHHGTSLASPGVLRVVVGVGVYLALIAVLGGALGWIVRRTAGAIAALVAILLVAPAVFQALPGSWSADVSRYLPGEAGGSFVTSIASPDKLSPWMGLGVLVLWVAAALALAAVLLRRRDA